LADFEKYAGGVEKVLEQIKTIFDIEPPHPLVPFFLLFSLFVFPLPHTHLPSLFLTISFSAPHTPFPVALFQLSSCLNLICPS